MENRITLEQLISILEEAKIDYHKFYDKGNKSASTRLRKSLQEVSTLCKISRNQVTEYKKTI